MVRDPGVHPQPDGGQTLQVASDFIRGDAQNAAPGGHFVGIGAVGEEAGHLLDVADALLAGAAVEARVVTDRGHFRKSGGRLAGEAA